MQKLRNKQQQSVDLIESEEITEDQQQQQHHHQWELNYPRRPSTPPTAAFKTPPILSRQATKASLLGPAGKL